MKILALIPARRGSKRVPGKNIRLLGGKPLINWTINAANNIPEISDILVSTDDPLIEEVSKKAGAYIPWLRPKILATDTAKSVDVAIHALDLYESVHGLVDGLLLLQPTSPFRTKETIKESIRLFIENSGRTVISVSTCDSSPMWMFKINEKKLIPLINKCGLDMRSQDLEPTYFINGSIYLITPNLLRANKSFFDPKAAPLIISSKVEAVDIDSEWDFKLAEFIVSN